MRDPVEPIVARARACIGVRFKAQGRGRDGLDCIGLVAAALGLRDVPANYALRGGSSEALAEGLRATGLCRVRGPQAGDVLVMRSGPGQLHLGIWTGDGLVHADAGLRRVVERPGPAPWQTISVWRRLSDAKAPPIRVSSSKRGSTSHSGEE
jgi:lipoprotein Spr